MSSDTKPSALKKMLTFIWGGIPIIVLLLIIGLLSSAIQSKSEKLEAVKTGVDELKGVRTAVGNIEKVVRIVRESEDTAQAIERLEKALGLSVDQAKSVVHLSLNELVKSSLKKRDKQIAYLEKQIAENKIDARMQIPDVNVVVLALAGMPVRDRMNLPGVVEPWVKFDIIAEVRGEVVEKRIDRGTPVQAGDIIGVLDKKDYEIALQAAKASYDTALASKNRLEKLYKEQLASRSQLDDITAQVEQYKAQMDSAMLNLERCTVRTPISGMINNLYFEKGQYLNIADPVAEVLQMDRVKVIVGIPESDVNAVGTVEAFTVKFDALDGKAFKAEKYFLSRASDPLARLYNLELRIDNPTGEILPDMFARVDILKQEKLDTLSIPLYAIITVNDEQVVYVVNDDTVHARKIKTGIQEGWWVEVTEGLKAGERVVVIGHRNISDGQDVNVIRTVSNMEDLIN